MTADTDLHSLDDDATVEDVCLNYLDRLQRREQKIIDRQKFQFLFNYLVETVQFLRSNNRAHCATDAEPQFVRKAARYVGQYASALGRQGEVITVDVDGTDVDLLVTEFGDADFMMINSFYVALLAESDEALSQLRAFDTDQLFVSTKVGFEYEQRFIRLFTTFLYRDSIDATIVEELAAIAESAEEVLAEFKPDYSYKIYLLEPLVDALMALAATDAPRFDESIGTAVARHRELWSSDQVIEPGAPPLRRWSEGWISLPSLAVMKLAQRHSVECTIRSAYAPERLLSL